jgi:hypothetical protein
MLRTLGEIGRNIEEVKMVEDESKDIESVRRMWDEHADTYDEWYETFEGAVEHYVDWKLLEGYLPKGVITSPYLIPSLAIVDPELSYSMSPKLEWMSYLIVLKV